MSKKRKEEEEEKEEFYGGFETEKIKKLVVKKTIQLKMNKTYSLKEGQELPEEVDIKFHNSLKKMEVI